MADFPDSTPVTEISRQIVEAKIDMLIDLLDRFDPEPDLEDGADLENDTADDEPLLGAPNNQAGYWGGISFHDDEREEDLSDDEPELGWIAVQARTGCYGWSDSNAYEPSLASTNGINQTHWWRGRNDEIEDEHDGREECCEDEGAQCDDEGAIEHDTMHSDDEVLSGHFFSTTERKAIDEVHDKLRAIVKQYDCGPAVRSVRNFHGGVTRIY